MNDALSDDTENITPMPAEIVENLNGDPKIAELVRQYKQLTEKLPAFKKSIDNVRNVLTASATTLQQDNYDQLVGKLLSVEHIYENFEYQLEEGADLGLDDDLWEQRSIPDDSKPFKNLSTKYDLVIEDLNHLAAPLQTNFAEVGGSDHRLELGNSKKHRVGGWKPNEAGFSEFLAYGLFRNAKAVKKQSRVKSTSIVLIKDGDGSIISFDVEREFEYTWGFGRQKAILMDFLTTRSSMISVTAYVAPYSLAAEYEVAKLCIEIMNNTAKLLDLAFEGFENELSRERAYSERIENEKSEKISLLQNELDQSAFMIITLQDEVNRNHVEMLQKTEEYENLIDDVCDELGTLFVTRKEGFLQQSSSLQECRKRLRPFFNDLRVRPHVKYNVDYSQEHENMSVSQATELIREHQRLKKKLIIANEEIERLQRASFDSEIFEQIHEKLINVSLDETNGTETNQEIQVLVATIGKQQNIIDTLQSQLRLSNEENNSQKEESILEFSHKAPVVYQSHSVSEVRKDTKTSTIEELPSRAGKTRGRYCPGKVFQFLAFAAIVYAFREEVTYCVGVVGSNINARGKEWFDIDLGKNVKQLCGTAQQNLGNGIQVLTKQGLKTGEALTDTYNRVTNKLSNHMPEYVSIAIQSIIVYIKNICLTLTAYWSSLTAILYAHYTHFVDYFSELLLRLMNKQYLSH